MKDKSLRKIAVILAFLIFSGINLYSQDRAAVITSYNAGVKQIQTNIDSAIITFENVITMSDKVGETAADLKQKAIQVLPGLYQKSVSAKLTAKKPGVEVVKTAKAALASAERNKNETAKDNAGKLLIAAYNRMATDYFSKNDLDNALLAFDSLLTVSPDYVAAIYNKALIYKSQNNSEALEQTVDLYLGKLTPGDSVKAKQASQMALEYFRAAGSKANQGDNLEEALNLLNKAAKYGEDKDLFYYFADVYNKQKEYDKGAEYAQKGLTLETGNAEAKAKFYYQLAVAQAAKGQTAEACESFKNALYGPFAEASKAQRTNLKCK